MGFKSLAESVKYISKGIPPKYTDVSTCHTIQVLNQKCNRNFKLSYDLARLHDCSKKSVSDDKLLQIGDIVINSTGTGTAGRIAQIDWLPCPTTVDGHMIILRPNDDINSKYFGYCVKHKQNQIELLAEGSTGQTEINRNRLLNEVEIFLPSFETQQKIAKTLSSLDDKIELNNRMNENLEEQAQAVFKSWFVDFEPCGGVMPSDWDIKPLSELTDIVTKGTTPTTLGKRFQKSGVNFIKAESILDTHDFDLSKFAYIDKNTDKLLKRSIINSGDILFTIAGTLGRFALVGSDIIPANTNQAVAIIRADKAQVSPEYLYSFFLGDWHNNYYSQRVQQAVQANLSLTTIKSLPIVVANKADKQLYENLLFPLLHRMRGNQLENQKLAQLRDALLLRLMSGEIDVDGVEV